MSKFNRHYKLGNGFENQKTIRNDLKEQLDSFAYTMLELVFKKDGTDYYMAYEGRVQPNEVEEALESAGYDPTVISFTKTPIELL